MQVDQRFVLMLWLVNTEFRSQAHDIIVQRHRTKRQVGGNVGTFQGHIPINQQGSYAANSYQQGSYGANSYQLRSVPAYSYQQEFTPFNSNQQRLQTPSGNQQGNFQGAEVWYPGMNQGGSATFAENQKCQRTLNLFPECSQLRKTSEVTSVNCGTNSFKRPRILGGRETVTNKFPWAVSLIDRISTYHMCGGVLITNSHVLTSAHCFLRYDINDVIIRLGEHSFDERDESQHKDFNIFRIHEYEPYSSRRSSRNDIAILKMDRPTNFNKYISPICLPPKGADSYTDEEATAIGWGKTEAQKSDSSVLREVSIKVWDNFHCRAVYADHNFVVSDKHICAGEITKGGKDTCQGDSGGPLMVQKGGSFDRKWYVIGIIAAGYGCGKPGIPGIYVRVSKYIDWIGSKTG